jgi:hypothetical protein
MCVGKHGTPGETPNPFACYLQRHTVRIYSSFDLKARGACIDGSGDSRDLKASCEQFRGSNLAEFLVKYMTAFISVAFSVQLHSWRLLNSATRTPETPYRYHSRFHTLVACYNTEQKSEATTIRSKPQKQWPGAAECQPAASLLLSLVSLCRCASHKRNQFEL